MSESIKELLNTVVENDYCIGCGLCASLPDSPLTMKLNEDGKFQPFLNDRHYNKKIAIDALSVCPFAKNNNKETEIGKSLFGEVENIKFDEYSGYYIKSYAGYVTEGDYRDKGSTGGMGNWIAAQLLKEGLVDGVIHVKSNTEDDDLLFNYQISNTVDELAKGAK